MESNRANVRFPPIPAASGLMSASNALRTLVSSEMLAFMTDLDRRWSLSNPGPEKLLVWLEPWADEFEVQARSTITMHAPTGGECEIGEVEWTPDHLVVWANFGSKIEVAIDGVHQSSASATIPIPDGLTKKMLNIMFAGQPTARLAGRPLDEPTSRSWWRRMRGQLGL